MESLGALDQMTRSACCRRSAEPFHAAETQLTRPLRPSSSRMRSRCVIQSTPLDETRADCVTCRGVSWIDTRAEKGRTNDSGYRTVAE